MNSNFSDIAVFFQEIRTNFAKGGHPLVTSFVLARSRWAMAFANNNGLVFHSLRRKSHLEIVYKEIYYSTITPFYHIWSREGAKYETVIHCSVPF